MDTQMSSSLPDNYTPPSSNLDTLSKGPSPADNATSQYGFSHTMIRVKDPIKSLDFYTKILGMTLVRVMPMESGKFTNYFLCYPQSSVPTDETEKQQWLWTQQGVLELCHNWGTELAEQNFQGYKSGNEPEHKGFGHICVFVDDLKKACDRFTQLNVQFKKRPEDGSMKYIAFILDPDGYWIEIIAKGGRRE
ncbi:unnamed protein product [Didymodactylos carnosus]|uniref:lactoylglutathione lyase n=1 Tax=Didymodactylos carnosus TaxID=1234261 RepID=A0A815G3E4_9BILA|nr:unnamed protein product [Didymodactylos carnosus]CAF1333322.1 unnamed protein product [Didymodactylos carnosus]CAF3759510.1 unnamed protein product [Didymodactylos carnosus]CAF4188974.1 unnamed protein product [Didymodactylos carnosus]